MKYANPVVKFIEDVGNLNNSEERSFDFFSGFYLNIKKVNNLNESIIRFEGGELPLFLKTPSLESVNYRRKTCPKIKFDEDDSPAHCKYNFSIHQVTYYGDWNYSGLTKSMAMNYSDEILRNLWTSRKNELKNITGVDCDSWRKAFEEYGSGKEYALEKACCEENVLTNTLLSWIVSDKLRLMMNSFSEDASFLKQIKLTPLMHRFSEFASLMTFWSDEFLDLQDILDSFDVDYSVDFRKARQLVTNTFK